MIKARHALSIVPILGTVIATLAMTASSAPAADMALDTMRRQARVEQSTCTQGDAKTCSPSGTVGYAQLNAKTKQRIDHVLGLAADQPVAKQAPDSIKCKTSSYPGTGVFHAECTLCYGGQGQSCCTCTVDSHLPGGCSGSAC